MVCYATVKSGHQLDYYQIFFHFQLCRNGQQLFSKLQLWWPGTTRHSSNFQYPLEGQSRTFCNVYTSDPAFFVNGENRGHAYKRGTRRLLIHSLRFSFVKMIWPPMYIIESSIFPTKFLKEYLRKFFGKCEWCAIDASELFCMSFQVKMLPLMIFVNLLFSVDLIW